jgi:hypothetical protein
MAAQTAGLRIRRRRVDHIHELVAEIAEREHIAAHLLTVTFRVTYYFFTIAFLIAGVVTLAEGRRDVATMWGGAGVGLVVVLLLAKGAGRVLSRAVAELREEFENARPDVAADAQLSGADAEPSTEPPVEPKPAADPPRA